MAYKTVTHVLVAENTKKESHSEIASLYQVFRFTRDVYPRLKQQLKDSGAVLFEPTINMYGKEVHQRRNIAFFSDTSKGYYYSRKLLPSTPFKKCSITKKIMERVNKYLGTNFNGVLVNIYTDGTKYISAHPDSEVGLDPSNKVVAGIAYGPGERKFRIRDFKTKKIVSDFYHTPCSLIVMDGEFQSLFTHEVPPVTKTELKGMPQTNLERISLTFRHHLE